MFKKLWEWFWQRRADYFFYESKNQNRMYNYMFCEDVKWKRGEYWTKQWFKLLFNKGLF